MRKLTYLGHSAFYLENDNYGILIDPFLKNNPLAKFDYKSHNITHIFVTHAHFDHLGDAVEISKSKNIPIITVVELANYCASKGAKAVGVNIGAKLDFDWGSVRFFNALHSSSNSELPYGGLACGLLFDIDGTTVYHAGDTGLMSEFTLIGELYKPYYALLPVGGFYTMDIPQAAVAAKMLMAKEVIPMHYNTFDNIKVNIQEFKDLIESQGQACIPLKANEYVEL